MDLPENLPAMRRDTTAWRAQVWISFGISVAACGIGLAWLPGSDIDRAFMIMAYVFCMSTAFALAKFIRDVQAGSSDTPLWRLVVWGGFALAMGMTGWGLARMEIQPVWKSYLGLGWLYLISNVFTLAKMLRDAHEADRFDASR
ncbi:YiaA/YiaB family inner membrane protein [Burkholderiaceae bacterium UC74_6]